MAIRDGRRRRQALADARAVIRLPSRRSLLPRASAVAMPGLIRRAFEPVQVRARDPVSRRLHRILFRLKQSQIRSRARADRFQKNPLMVRGAPCRSRARRREVMFAARVAGRGWSRGGPRMRGARHSVESRFTCRR